MDTLKELAAIGANFDVPDNDARTPLHLAAEYGRVETVKFLIEQGVDIDHEDLYGINALIQAIFNYHDDVAKILKEAGSNLSFE